MGAQAVKITITPVSTGAQIAHRNPIRLLDSGDTGALGHATLGAAPPVDSDWVFIIPLQTAAGKQNLAFLFQVIALMLQPSVGNGNTIDIGALTGTGADTLVSILNGNAL